MYKENINQVFDKLNEFIKNNSINHKKIEKLSDENLNKAYKDAVMKIRRSPL